MKSLPTGPYKIAQPREEFAILDNNDIVIGSAHDLPTAKLFQQSVLMAVFIDEISDQLSADRQRQAKQILSEITGQ